MKKNLINILKKFVKRSKNLDATCSVKIGGTFYKPDSKWKKTKNYLYKLRYKYGLRVAFFKKEFELKRKIKETLSWLINILITGAVIYYIVNHKNMLSYGLLFATVTYYIKWFIKEIKRPLKEEGQQED